MIAAGQVFAGRPRQKFTDGTPPTHCPEPPYVVAPAHCRAWLDLLIERHYPLGPVPHLPHEARA